MESEVPFTAIPPGTGFPSGAYRSARGIIGPAVCRGENVAVVPAIAANEYACCSAAEDPVVLRAPGIIAVVGTPQLRDIAQRPVVNWRLMLYVPASFKSSSRTTIVYVPVAGSAVLNDAPSTARPPGTNLPDGS